MAEDTVKIVITGAESTGKSILSEALSNHYQMPWIPEFARGYIENLGRHYTYDDVEFIARHQIEEEERLSVKGGIIFFDTWLIITKVWFEFVYGREPEWLDRFLKNSHVNLFLVCDTDLPWEPDTVRENGGETRLRLQERYIECINQYDFTYRIISGKGELRTRNAIKAIDDYLQSVGRI